MVHGVLDQPLPIGGLVFVTWIKGIFDLLWLRNHEKHIKWIILCLICHAEKIKQINVNWHCITNLNYLVSKSVELYWKINNGTELSVKVFMILTRSPSFLNVILKSWIIKAFISPYNSQTIILAFVMAWRKQKSFSHTNKYIRKPCPSRFCSVKESPWQSVNHKRKLMENGRPINIQTP